MHGMHGMHGRGRRWADRWLRGGTESWGWVRGRGIWCWTTAIPKPMFIRCWTAVIPTPMFIRCWTAVVRNLKTNTMNDVSMDASRHLFDSRQRSIFTRQWVWSMGNNRELFVFLKCIRMRNTSETFFIIIIIMIYPLNVHSERRAAYDLVLRIRPQIPTVALMISFMCLFLFPSSWLVHYLG